VRGPRYGADDYSVSRSPSGAAGAREKKRGWAVAARTGAARHVLAYGRSELDREKRASRVRAADRSWSTDYRCSNYPRASRPAFLTRAV